MEFVGWFITDDSCYEENALQNLLTTNLFLTKHVPLGLEYYKLFSSCSTIEIL